MKTSHFLLHGVSVAVLTVLASSPLLAVEANPTGAVHGRQIEVQGNPVIAGNPYAWQVLTVATLPTASDADSTDSHSGWRYVWQVGGEDVTSEQDAGSLVAIPPFLVRVGDDGKAVRVCVKAVASSGYPDDTRLSSQVCSNELEIKNSAPAVSGLAIAGTPEVGNTLTGSYSYNDVDGDADASTFQWYRADNSAGTINRVAIAGATAKTYTVAAADRNKYLVFEVAAKSATGTPDTGNVLSRTTTTAVPGTAPAVSGLAIAGTAAIGNTLTGSYSYYDAEGDANASTFQWYRADDAAGIQNRVAISGATGRTYMVTGWDVDKYLVFEVTPRSSSGLPNVGHRVSQVTALIPGMLVRFSKPESTLRSWSDANTYCNNLVQQGYSNWRLPTQTELSELYNLWPNDRLSWQGWPTDRSYHTSTRITNQFSSYEYYVVSLRNGYNGSSWIDSSHYLFYVTCIR